MILPEVLQNMSDSPHPTPFIIKTVELAPVFEAEIDQSLALVKSEGRREFKRILMAARVKLEKKNYKNPTVSIIFTLLTRNLADNFP